MIDGIINAAILFGVYCGIQSEFEDQCFKTDDEKRKAKLLNIAKLHKTTIYNFHDSKAVYQEEVDWQKAKDKRIGKTAGEPFFYKSRWKKK